MVLRRLKDKFVSTFLPSAEVSAARRKDVFGTESKAVAGAVILGSAGAAILAAPAVAAAGVRGVAAKAGSAFLGASTPTKAAVVLGAPIIAGSIIREPKVVTRTVGGVANLQGNLFQAAKNPSFQNVKDVFTENPLITGGLAALTVGAVAAPIVSAAVARSSAARDRIPDVQEVQTFMSSAPLPPAPLPTQLPESEPITPETQIIGTEAGSGAVTKRRKKRVKAKTPSNNVRVQVLNQQTYIQGGSR